MLDKICIVMFDNESILKRKLQGRLGTYYQYDAIAVTNYVFFTS